MKQSLFLLAFAFTTISLSYSQTDSAVAKPRKTPFKRGYIRLGIDKLGGSLNPVVAPAENIYDGNLGAGNGYTLEFGHIFYFLNRNKRSMLNAGLDWTILNLAYSPLNKWGKYADERNEQIDNEGTHLSAAITSKLGPVIAFNPADKLVIEAKFQLTYGLYLPVCSYDIISGPNAGYSFGTDNENYFESKGLGTSFGATVRYGFFGFAADWSNADIPVTYYIDEPGKTEVTGSKKIPFKNFKLKLSFTF